MIRCGPSGSYLSTSSIRARIRRSLIRLHLRQTTQQGFKLPQFVTVVVGIEATPLIVLGVVRFPENVFEALEDFLAQIRMVEVNPLSLRFDIENPA